MIIGITGFKQSGKDSVAKILRLRHAHRVYGMADPMYMMMAVGLGIASEDVVEAGRIDLSVLNRLGVSIRVMYDKEEIIPEYGCSLRHIMQTLGTEWGRELISKEVWITRFGAWRDRNGYPEYVAIPDVRFDNEALAIREMGGVMIEVRRPDMDGGDAHSSESGINTELIDHVIDNDCCKSILMAKVDSLLAELK
ncbi:MAG: hypothetical protein KAJ73_00550 [Zetaproteobacteria bacterium]|nr:hypothetical protein [Zetaproteobacteria bacterium]